jgi:hypothetical protein
MDNSIASVSVLTSLQPRPCLQDPAALEMRHQRVEGTAVLTAAGGPQPTDWRNHCCMTAAHSKPCTMSTVILHCCFTLVRFCAV